ncbi:MAG: hypothetical protein SPJ34_05815 [Candidatus Ornithospirochaeta sp.]|nr:hypothetical protein [Candidatus Ornithospirochaeta sp.]
MERDEFIAGIIDQGWSEAGSSDDSVLAFEREGTFIFVFSDSVKDSLYSPEWSVAFSEIKLTRSRRHYFEIEKKDGTSIEVLSEDDIEIGCMG